MNSGDYPKTRKEAKQQGAAYYFTGEPCKQGHIALRKTKGVCVECMKTEWHASLEKRAAYFSEYNKSEKGVANKKRYYAANTELVKLKAISRPPEVVAIYRTKWKQDHPEIVKADTSYRRRRHKQATPLWLTKAQKAEIKQIYLDAMTTSRITGVQYVVDHIVPLRGTLVSGLHVPWNLRVITQEENLLKSNKEPQ